MVYNLLNEYVDAMLEARAIRLELEIMTLRDKGVPLDDIEIVYPAGSERPYVRQVSNG